MLKGWNGTIGQFRLLGIMEGISYIILLFIAMPLKYYANLPNAVKYVGWAHGVLFVAFGLFLIKVWVQYRWSFGKATLAFVTSLVPFGTFWLDKKLQKEYPSSQS
jgi:integral membrane protein